MARMASQKPMYVAGQERGVLPMGVWSTSSTRSICSTPNTASQPINSIAFDLREVFPPPFTAPALALLALFQRLLPLALPGLPFLLPPLPFPPPLPLLPDRPLPLASATRRLRF